MGNWIAYVALAAAIGLLLLVVFPLFSKNVDRPGTARRVAVATAQIMEWLLFMVTEAEEKYGGKTGRIKLAFVYSMFADRFPDMAEKLTFSEFAEWVDLALGQMNEVLKDGKGEWNVIHG